VTGGDDLLERGRPVVAALAASVGARVPQLEANRRVVGEAIAAGLGNADLSALAGHLRAQGSPRQG